jgi:methionyl-tRNA formyltransferase
LDVDNLISGSQLIVSAHCKRIFPTKIVDSVRCINIHPGFNPINRGWFPQVFSILNNQIAGATIHLMTSDVDAGPVIAQEKVSIEFQDNAFDVYQKIIAKEKELFLDNLGKILDLNYKGVDIEEGNYNSLSDFKALCSLDLESNNSLEYHLRLLKSLTFPGFQNAYVWVGGEKYFIEVKITPSKQDHKT